MLFTLNAALAPYYLSQYSVLFTGATLQESAPQVTTDLSSSLSISIWELLDRCSLLSASCYCLKDEDDVEDSVRSDFAVQTWLEAERLAAALDAHTCNPEPFMRTFVLLRSLHKSTYNSHSTLCT